VVWVPLKKGAVVEVMVMMALRGGDVVDCLSGEWLGEVGKGVESWCCCEKCDM
jgi:hypothetical protein